MEQSLLDGIAQSGTLGLLLGASLYWFARVHLPERDRLQRELLERIARGHEEAVARLAAAFETTSAQLSTAQREVAELQGRALERLRDSLEQNTRSLAQNSQALLAASFARRRSGGLSAEEAEALLRRVSDGSGQSAEAA